MAARPKFIVVEGIDGSGKSTFVKTLSNALLDRGRCPAFFSEPGTSSLGLTIRTMLSSGDFNKLPAVSQLLLMEAVRVDNLRQISKLFSEAAKNLVVLSDRHSDSSWAYQGALGVPDEVLLASQSTYSDMIGPDLTIFLDIAPEVAVERIQARSRDTGTAPDPMEQRDLGFFQKVRARYWDRIMADRDHYYVVNGEYHPYTMTEIARNLIFNIYPKE